MNIVIVLENASAGNKLHTEMLFTQTSNPQEADAKEQFFQHAIKDTRAAAK